MGRGGPPQNRCSLIAAAARPATLLPSTPPSPSLNRLAVQRKSEAIALDLLGHAQADDEVENLEDDQRHDAVINEHRADADCLVDGLHEIAFEQAGGAAVLLDREHAGEQCASSSTDCMHAEGAQGVVVG